MNKFDILDLENIEDTNMPSSQIKQQVTNMIKCSGDCSAKIEYIEKESGKYRIILEGRLVGKNVLDSSYYIG